jgi:hypothetical protein
MTDDDIEARIRELIEANMDEENRKQALRWLEERCDAFGAVAMFRAYADNLDDDTPQAK